MNADGELVGAEPARRGWRGLVGMGCMPCILAAIVVVAFRPVLHADFVRFDDPKVLTENQFVKGLNVQNIQWMFFRTHMGHYQPLTWLSYAVEHALWGLDPRGYHAVNLALHALNTWLVFVLTRRLLRVGASEPENTGATAFGPAVAAAIWGVHPLRVESVAWVTERRDVLSAAFLIAAAIAYLRSVPAGGALQRGPTNLRMAWYLTTLGLLTLSLLSKAWGMSFFVIAALLDIFVMRRVKGRPWMWGHDDWRRAARVLVVEKAPMAVLGLAAGAVAAYAQSESNAAKTLEEWGLQARAVQVLDGLWFYLYRTVFPHEFSVLHELPPQENMRLLAGEQLLTCVCMCATGLLVLIVGRKRPGVLAAAAAYVVLLLPVLGILQSGDQLVAERYSYLALIGWMVVVGAGIEELWARRGWRKPLAVGTGVVVGMLATLTHGQSRVWKDTESLWSHAARVTPTSTVITNYGMEIARLGRPEEATRVLHRAVEMDPDNVNAGLLIGNIHRDDRKFVQAEAAFLAVAKHPTQGFMGRVNLGGMYIQHMGRSADGVEQIRMAVAEIERLGPRATSAMPFLALGRALRSTGDIEGAKQAFRRALEFEETTEQARRELLAMGEDPGRKP